MTTTKLTAADLRHFTGTENWYRHALARSVLYTDGIRYVAQNAGAYWLLDIIALSQKSVAALRDQPFQSWTLKVEADASAVLTCTDGNHNPLYRQVIPFTDFPMPEFEAWVENNVILLPSEH